MDKKFWQGLYIRMKEVDHKKLKKQAEAEDRSISSLIRLAISRYLEENP